MNLMKYRWLNIGLLIFVIVAGITLLFVSPNNGWGAKPGPALNLGIDFTGGTKIYFPVPRQVSSDEVAAVLREIEIDNFKFNPPQPTSYIDSNGKQQYQVLVYTSFLNDTEQEIVIKALEAKFGSVDKKGLDITRVNPLIGAELIQNAIRALLIAGVLMLIYIWYRFELISGIAAVLALIHDSLFVLGIFALLGKEVNATLIAALLTVVGYSINDTIVIFDRIRENVKNKSRDLSFSEIVNLSILQSFRRSLNTSITTVLAILLLFLAVPNISEFCFAMIVGITVGTYSSIFMASPIWIVCKEWLDKRKLLRKEAVAK